MSINKVMLLGRLGNDPEVKHTPTGQAVCNFSMATSEKWTDKQGQKQEKTEWHRVVVWGKLAEICGQYLGKGRETFIEGKIVTRAWEDKEGNKRYTTEIVANNVQFIGGNPNANATAGQGQQASQPQANQAPANNPAQGYNNVPDTNFASDDIPF